MSAFARLVTRPTLFFGIRQDGPGIRAAPSHLVAAQYGSPLSRGRHQIVSALRKDQLVVGRRGVDLIVITLRFFARCVGSVPRPLSGSSQPRWAHGVLAPTPEESGPKPREA